MSQVESLPFERVFGSILKDRDSGILTVTDGKVRRLFCFDQGMLVFSASNIIEEQLDELMRRDSIVSPGARAKATIEAKKAEITPWAWLVAEEHLSQEQLEEAIRRHSKELLATATEQDRPELQFNRGRANLAGKPVAEWDALPWFLDWLGQHPKSDSAIRVRIGPPGMRPEAIKKEIEQLPSWIADDDLRLTLWRQCDGSTPIESLAPSESALRSLYAMVLLGELKESEAVSVAPSSSAEPAVTRKELIARLDKALGATHYQVLEVMPDVDTEQITSAYYTLARRYHPDKFRTGENTDLLERIETFFAQVTEAHQTLSQEEHRRQYDEQLAAIERQDAASQEPEHDQGYLARQNFLRAKVLIQKNQYQQAVTFLENAIDQQENIPEYHLELGRVLTRNPRRREEAEQHLRLAVELDPTVAAAHRALVDFLMKRERHEDARRVAEAAQQWVPGDAEIERMLGELAPKKGRGLFGR